MGQPKTFWTLLLVALIPLSSVSCEGTATRDDWYSPPEDIHAFHKTRIPVLPVLQEQVLTSVSLLKNVSVVEISNKTVLDLTGKSNSSGKRALLVRGLVYAFQENGFTIYQNGLTLWVHHGVLSRSSSMRKYPVVIYVDELPTEVLVSCNVAG